MFGCGAWSQTVTDTHITTHHDSIPRFVQNPDHIAIQSGLWSDPATWGGQPIPDCDSVETAANLAEGKPLDESHVGHDVQIPEGITVTYDMRSATEIGSIEVGGVLRFEPSAPTMLHCDDITVMPSGVLQMGSVDQPITTEIVFNDSPFGDNDREQFGHGLIVFGRLIAHGKPKTAYVRATSHITAGASGSGSDRDVTNWSSDDTLVVPHTFQQIIRKRSPPYQNSSEVVSCTGGVNWSEPLTFDHPGMAANPWGIQRFPAIANLTRSIVFRSENLEGVRGHVIILAMGTADLSFIEFRSMGRTRGDMLIDNTDADHIGTNQIARYPFHLHHSSGDPASLVGCTFRDNLRWAIVVHGSNNNLIENNVVFDSQGSAIMAEDGTEVGNQYIANLIIKVRGGRHVGDKRAGASAGSPNLGLDSSGIWMRGGSHIIRDNLVFDVGGWSYNINGYGRRRLSSKVTTESFLKPIIEFANNEAAGSRGGLWQTWSQGQISVKSYRRRVFDGLVAWNVSTGVEEYHDGNNTYKDFVLVNDPSVSSQNSGVTYWYRPTTRVSHAMKLGAGTYENFNNRITGLRASGWNVGITTTRTADEGTVFTAPELANFMNFVYTDEEQERVTTIIDPVFLPSSVGPTLYPEKTPTDIFRLWLFEPSL